MGLTLYCNSATLFREDGALDPAAMAVHYERIVGQGQPLSIGSGGAGEGHVLEPSEYRALCELAVQVSRGRVRVMAALRESRSAASKLQIAREAIAAGVDLVQVYQLNGGHGMVPTEAEQWRYFATVLEAVPVPVAICVHGLDGYLASPSLLRRLRDSYPQLSQVHLMGGLPDRYYLRVAEALPATMTILTDMAALPSRVSVGASGALLSDNNIIPRTCRRIAEAYASGDEAGRSEAWGVWVRFNSIVTRWGPANARWIKMAMNVLGLGNGVLRPPYVLPDEQERLEMRRLLEPLDIPRREGLEGAAG